MKGKIANLRDAYEKMLNELGTGSQGVLTGAVDVTRLLIDNLDKLGKILLQLIISYGIYKVAMFANASSTAGWTFATTRQFYALLATEKAQKLLNAAMSANPAVIIASAVYRDWETDRKSTRLNSSHRSLSRMPSSA